MEDQKTLNNNRDADKFYEELDKSKVHQSCCTCQTLAILFLTILVILGGGLFYIYYQVTREKVFSFKLPSISLQSFNQKLGNLKSDELGNIQMTLTNEDVSALLSEGLSFQSFILKDIQVQIMPGEMIIYGRLVKPLKSKVVISTVPKPKDGQIEFEVKSITAGNLNFPKFVNVQIAKSLTGLVNAKLAPIYQKFSVQEINLEENKLILKGKAKWCNKHF